MSRLIKSDRAVELQGRRAGFVTRVVADAIDVGIAFAIFVVIYAGISILWDFLFSETIEIKVQPPGFNAGGMWLTAVIYFALAWSSTGRSIGKQVMGLRVVRRDATSMRPRQAFGRALFCVTFYWLVMWPVLFSRRNAGLHDMVCKTVVVYDWIPTDDTRHLPAPPAPPRSRRRRRELALEQSSQKVP
jgi:uncharacterized RDD family membrane protein YckC